jgi:hypothetical protein
MTEYKFSPAVESRIRHRLPFPFGDATDPFVLGYTTPGGSYILASNGRQSDDGRPHDLILIYPDNSLVRLRPTVSNTMIRGVKDALEVEWRQCGVENPRGYGPCVGVEGHIERDRTRHHTDHGALWGSI